MAWTLTAMSCSDRTAIVADFTVPRASDAGAMAPPGPPAIEVDSGGISAPMDAGRQVAIGTAGGMAAVSDAGVSTPDAQVVPDMVGIEPSTHDDFCAGHGPAIRVLSGTISGSMPVCTAGIARKLFSYALCSCTNLKLGDGSIFAINAFDSRLGPASAMPTGQLGAAVGINGSLNSGASIISLYGTTVIAGGGTLQLPGTCVFEGDLKTNAAIDVPAVAATRVGRDLWSDADILTTNTLTVGRDVYLTPGRVDGRVSMANGKALTRDFVVEPPCACGDHTQVDVAAIVTSAHDQNDNAVLGLSPDVLSGMLSMGSVPTALQCGRFALGALSLPAKTLTTVSGRLALFVDGDLTIADDFASDLGAAGELDVFISGNLIVSGPALIGTTARPAALRLYVAGSRTIYISEQTRYAAQIYAPNASVVVTEALTMGFYGSIFARSIEAQNLGYMYFDQAIIEASDACSSPAPAHCNACDQCPAGLACMEGVCAACQSDTDCCTPLVCTTGKCQPLAQASP